MAIGGHNKRAAIRVPELHCDIGVRNTIACDPPRAHSDRFATVRPLGSRKSAVFRSRRFALVLGFPLR